MPREGATAAKPQDEAFLLSFRGFVDYETGGSMDSCVTPFSCIVKRCCFLSSASSRDECMSVKCSTAKVKSSTFFSSRWMSIGP